MNNQAAQTMPELPDSQYRGGNDVFGKEFPLYTADQMHQYARDYAAMLAAAPAASGGEDGPNWRYAVVSALEYLEAGDTENAIGMLKSAATMHEPKPPPAASVSERARELRERAEAHGGGVFVSIGDIRALEQALTQQRGECVAEVVAVDPVSPFDHRRAWSPDRTLVWSSKLDGLGCLNLPIGTKLYTTPQPSADAVRELVK